MANDVGAVLTGWHMFAWFAIGWCAFAMIRLGPPESEDA